MFSGDFKALILVYYPAKVQKYSIPLTKVDRGVRIQTSLASYYFPQVELFKTVFAKHESLPSFVEAYSKLYQPSKKEGFAGKKLHLRCLRGF